MVRRAVASRGAAHGDLHDKQEGLPHPLAPPPSRARQATHHEPEAHRSAARAPKRPRPCLALAWPLFVSVRSICTNLAKAHHNLQTVGSYPFWTGGVPSLWYNLLTEGPSSRLASFLISKKS